MITKNRLCTKDLVVLSLLAAITFGAKLVMAPIPNVEPVTLLLAVTTLLYGRKAFYTCFVYVMLEGLVYGFGIWWLSYLYVWGLWVLAVLLLSKRIVNRNVFTFDYVIITVASSLFGLCFGALFAIPYLFVGGWEMAFSYWVSGISYDVLHALGNTLMCGALLRPLHRLLRPLMLNTVTRND